MAVRRGSTLQAPECCRTILFLHASKDYCTGSPSSVHKENHCDFQHCFAYYELFLKTLYEKFNINIQQKYGHKYSNKLYLGKLAHIVVIFCVTWAQFIAILHGFVACCLFGVVFLHKKK